MQSSVRQNQTKTCSWILMVLWMVGDKTNLKEGYYPPTPLWCRGVTQTSLWCRATTRRPCGGGGVIQVGSTYIRGHLGDLLWGDFPRKYSSPKLRVRCVFQVWNSAPDAMFVFQVCVDELRVDTWDSELRRQLRWMGASWFGQWPLGICMRHFWKGTKAFSPR